MATLRLLTFVVCLLGSGTTTAYEWQLPKGFPEPIVPSENPMSEAKVKLGRSLFFDKRLSANESYSCASCHQAKFAFSDARAQAIGSTGQVHPRSTMSLTNVAYNSRFGWADNQSIHLEQQALIPLNNTNPVELGFLGNEGLILQRFSEDSELMALVRDAFGDNARFNLAIIQKSLASFQRTLISGNSPYDKWLFEDDRKALSDSAKRGMSLFFSEALACGMCHSGLNFSGDFVFAGSKNSLAPFINNGLVDNDLNMAEGLAAMTDKIDDEGKFKVPILRNIEFTAPYMHDGRLRSLTEVIDHYAAGGTQHPNQDPLVKGFSISDSETQDLIHFLQSLSDPSFIESFKEGLYQ